MKLKKFAAMMLAGVMAVSMLAGCEGKAADNDSDGDKGNGTTQTTGVSAVVYENLSQASKNIVKLSDDASLNASLQKVVDDYLNVADASNMYANGFVDSNSAIITNLKAELIDAMDCKDWGTQFTATADKAETRVNMAYAGKGMSDKAVLEEVADWIDQGLSTMPTDGASYTYTYTGSVSIADKTFEDTNGVSRTVKVVAVSITQTPTKK